MIVLPALISTPFSKRKARFSIYNKNYVFGFKVVKVADFGVARFQNQGGVMTAETGTYRWMAPEVCVIYVWCFLWFLSFHNLFYFCLYVRPRLWQSGVHKLPTKFFNRGKKKKKKTRNLGWPPNPCPQKYIYMVAQPKKQYT